MNRLTFSEAPLEAPSDAPSFTTEPLTQSPHDESGRVEALLDAMQARVEAFEQELQALPAQRPCPHHPTRQAKLKRSASFAARAPVYICAYCVRASQRQARQHALLHAGIPPEVVHANFSNFITERPLPPDYDKHTPHQFLQACQRFAAGDWRNLILCGTPGIGKGHLAAAVAGLQHDAGATVRWMNCPELFRRCHAAYRDQTVETLLRRCSSPALLVLDELGLRELPADGEEILLAILDRRRQSSLQTLLLGNHPADVLRHWLGSRITDRLRSGGVCLRYGEWESLRGTSLDGACGVNGAFDET